MPTKIDSDKFKQLLLHRRKDLEALLKTGSDSAKTVELDQSRVGRLSRMDALQSQAMQQENNRRRDQELKRIASALQRIAEDDYGYCLRCDQPIAEPRLEYDPSVTLCIQCAKQ